MVITCKEDSEDIRIYINNILHIRIPRDKNMILHSWVEGNSKTFIIETICFGDKQKFVYDNRYMWENILLLLDKSL